MSFFKFFSTIVITGLGFGLEDTGFGLGLEENWPWPRTCCPRTHPCKLLQDARGQPPAKRVKRSVQQQQQRLYKLCCDRRDGTKTVEATLRAIGHCVRLQ